MRMFTDVRGLPQRVLQPTLCDFPSLRNPRLISAFCYGCSRAISLAEATQEKNMTQLNLSDRHSTTAQGSSSVKENGRSISNQTVGALGALVMFAAVIGIGSCSRGNGKPA